MRTLLVGDSGELRTSHERWEFKGLLLQVANLGRCWLYPDSVGREYADRCCLARLDLDETREREVRAMRES